VSRSPDDLRWLTDLIRSSPLMVDRTVRQHWLTLLPWLDAGTRYALAGILLDVERGYAALERS
jgi:hypothetical protein